ncbi:MAG: glycosyltransferase family 39 protein [Nitrospirae bacterium]|nr:glycosyltransferase family 39 protein [Nitrospirota bacterium]
MSTSSFSETKYTLRDCLLLLIFGAIIYIPFLGIPVWDGNEPVRVIVAKEMLRTGNWIMPMLHGNPYFAKPPLMNWLMAASGGLFGVVNEWTSRLPSVLLMLMTGMSVYFLSKKWLAREGRLFAALMMLCMYGPVRAGREAEIDSLQTFVISFILLLWINGYLKQWKPAVLWGLTLSLAGIGFLSKGPQMLMFFYMSIIPYLLLRKRISFFFSKAHVFGLGLLLLVLAVYLMLLLQWTTLERYIHMWLGEGMQRTESRHISAYLLQVLEYPFELLPSFLPCLLFLIPLAIYKDLRQEAGKLFDNEFFTFSFVVIAVNLPFYWLLPNTRYRYFLPAYPFAALAVGFVFELYLRKMQAFPAIKVFFVKFLKVLAILTLSLAVAVIPAVIALHLKFSFLILFFIACLMISGMVVLYKAGSARLPHVPVYVTAITALFFLVYTDITVGLDKKRGSNPREIASEIDLLLPQDAGVVYEMGYRRYLTITCYLNREVRQVNSFADLKELKKEKGGIYFIYDAELLDVITGEDKNIFLKEIHSEEIYSRKYKSRRRGDRAIAVGKIS